MLLGIDVLLEKRRELLEGKRVGILAHVASQGAGGRHTVDRLVADKGFRVTALFGPEHGITAAAQDMEPVATCVDPSCGLPIYSLYGKTFESLTPTEQMLEDVDVLVVDLQDIGSRYYTYVWTTILSLKACQKFGQKVIICDRPNPIGGTLVEGSGIEKGFESFVGLASLPVRHGMTLGEIVQMVNGGEKIGADLTVIPMEGWGREMSWPDTGLEWIPPSPNMRSFTAALLYPGMCLLEGTNISEGRGTDTPFEIVGAPYIDVDELLKSFETLGLEGIRATPTAFIPNRQKWAGRMCHGIRWVVEDPQAFRPYLTGLAFIWLINRLYRDVGFEWQNQPYEFVSDKPAIDLLTGSPRFREKINVLSVDDLRQLATPSESLLDERKKALIYQ